MKKLICIFFFILAVHFAGPSSAQSRREYCVMFYNAENLFHPSNDSTVADDDFTPEGVRRWNFYRYNRKIAAMCKVILAVNGWEPPDAVCLSEIENRQVLEDIRFHPLMLGQQYRPLHRDSPDRRGIDVGILYRGDRLECLDTAWIEIRNAKGEPVQTREILSATFRLKTTGDTVVIFANHWTSKYGGALETEGKRMLQSRLLGEYIDGLPGAETSNPTVTRGIGVIAGGDLNDLTGSAPVQMLTDTFQLEEVFPGDTFPTANESGAADGHRFRPRLRTVFSARPSGAMVLPAPDASYKYQGIWESIDHVFVGGSLQVEHCRAAVYSNPQLLEEDTKYTGKKPFRTYNGFSYHGGYSDHLPLLLHFAIPDDQEWDR